MTTPEESLSKEIYDTWRSYVAWQERLFAGYLTVLAALGYGFLHATTHVRYGIFAFAIVISVVFRIIDWRTSELVNRCQSCGEAVVGGASIYAGINHLRYAGSVAPSHYSFALDILTASVAVGGGVGIMWIHKMELSYILPAAAIVFAIAVRKLTSYSRAMRSREKIYLDGRISENDATS